MNRYLVIIIEVHFISLFSFLTYYPFLFRTSLGTTLRLSECLLDKTVSQASLVSWNLDGTEASSTGILQGIYYSRKVYTELFDRD